MSKEAKKYMVSNDDWTLPYHRHYSDVPGPPWSHNLITIISARVRLGSMIESK